MFLGAAHIKHPGDWGELYFRDYLQKYPDVAGEYETLKLALKEQFEHDWDAYTKGKSDFVHIYTQKAREDVDQAIAAAMTFTQFIAALRKEGYEVKTGVKHLAVRPFGKERFVRLKTLGDDYTEEAIKRRILQNRTPRRPPPLPEPKRKRCTFKGSLKTAKKLTGL